MNAAIDLSPYKNICLVWGWTGGHVTPLVSLVKIHENLNQNYFWIGSKNSLEEQEAKKNTIPFFPIHVLRLWTTKSWKIIFYPFILLYSVFQARRILLEQKTELIFCKWWPGSLSVWIASWLLIIPLWIHESDTIPGRSNRILGYFAQRVFLGFNTSWKFFQEKKITVSGQILHPDIEKPAKKFKIWKTDKNHVLVICGSQGSKNVFEAISRYCDNLDVEWIILLGLLNGDSREKFNTFKNISLYDWIDAHTLGSVLSKTDLVITRWSATTLAEVDHFGIKKIMIPLPWSAWNHQYYNALWYKENKEDILIEEDYIDELPWVIVEALGEVIINRTMETETDFLQ
jgi:UDP-N-acetylglucosamine--N-acetylmuramyl-(pentapeptide) pyrophosphoryl-undecaprenol N-acetylglucosamine transferase